MHNHLYLMPTMDDPLTIELPTQTVTSNDIAFFGCSFTDDTTVFVDKNKMYGTVMAKHFNKNIINFAKGGTGNYRSFDLIGQINFEPGSSLVLQLAELSRIRWYTNEIQDRMLSVDSGPVSRSLLSTYHDRFLIYDLIRQLRIIVELCRLKQIRLVIWSIARLFDDELNNTIEYYLHKFPEYIYVNPTEYRVDNGTDGINRPIGEGHPGPKSHQIIAQKLIAHFESLYN